MLFNKGVASMQAALVFCSYPAHCLDVVKVRQG